MARPRPPRVKVAIEEIGRVLCDDRFLHLSSSGSAADMTVPINREGTVPVYEVTVSRLGSFIVIPRSSGSSVFAIDWRGHGQGKA